MSGHRKFWPHFDAIFLLSHLSLNFPDLFWKFLEVCLHLQHLLWNFGLSVIPYFYDTLGVDPWGQWSPSQDYSSSECSGWFGETESRSRRLGTRDQKLPSAFRRSGRSAASSPGCSYQIFGSQFEVIFLLHYSVTSVSDCFCFSMGVTDSCYTCFYFWNLCYIFFLFQNFYVYSMEEEDFYSENWVLPRMDPQQRASL